MCPNLIFVIFSCNMFLCWNFVSDFLLITVIIVLELQELWMLLVLLMQIQLLWVKSNGKYQLSVSDGVFGVKFTVDNKGKVTILSTSLGCLCCWLWTWLSLVPDVSAVDLAYNFNFLHKLAYEMVKIHWIFSKSDI